MVRRFATQFSSILAAIRLVTVVVVGFLAHDAFGQSPSLFQPVVTYNPGGANSNSVAVADINGDGKADLIVANCGPVGFGRCRDTGNAVGEGLIGVLLGDGSGAFSSPLVYDSGAADATSVAVADVNGDGKLDLVVAHCGSGGTTDCGQGGVVSVLLGNGDGTFQLPLTYPSGGVSADSVKVADVNNDGKLDIVVANFFDTLTNSKSGALGVLLGNGDGTFQQAVAYASGKVGATSVAVADVNNDGILDLVVSNGACPNTNDAECVGVLLGKGDGTFQPVVTYRSGGGEGTSIAFADVNGDSNLDLLVTNWCVGCPNTVGVLLGNGDGTFQAARTYGSGGYFAWSVAVVDINGDEKPDLLVANQCASLSICTNSNGAVGVLLNNGDGTFQPAVPYFSGGTFAFFVAAADLNGDARPDLVVVNHGQFPNTTSSLGVLLNKTPIDTTPPVITVSATPKVLWPPNGKLVPVAVFGTITDAGSGVNAKTATYAVTDEYRVMQPSGAIRLGPGGTYSFIIQLQASRRGTDLDGRQYVITIRAKDNAGNVGSATALVTVPHRHPI